MIIKENTSLVNHHTFHIPASTRWFVEYDNEQELIALLSKDLIKNNNYIHIGSGSNLLFVEDYKGVVLHSKINTIQVEKENNDYIWVKVGAGIVLDDFISHCIECKWYGLENLSHIPGEVGASAVQNVGAYGAEAKDFIDSVYVVSVEDGNNHTFSNAECKYAYRDSIFKHEYKGRYIITYVTYKLNKTYCPNLQFNALKKMYQGLPIPSQEELRNRIIEVRREKLPEPDEIGSAGSFFMNPIVDENVYDALAKDYPDMPHFIVDKGIKLSAAWLIDKSGLKGKEYGGAATYHKQCLVIVNKHNATANDVLSLCEIIQKEVSTKFGVMLKPEVNFIKN